MIGSNNIYQIKMADFNHRKNRGKQVRAIELGLNSLEQSRAAKSKAYRQKWGHSGSPATVGPQETPEKTAPPQKVPISRFYLLSLLKTRSDSPGAASPQNFPILKHYASE